MFKDFEQQLLTVTEQEESEFPVAHMVQLAMPQLASDMQSGFLLISSMMRDMQGQIQTLQAEKSNVGVQMERRFADFLSFGSHLFRSGVTSQQENANQGQAMTDAAENRYLQAVANDSNESSTYVNDTVETPPSYSLSRTIISITDLWREYAIGLTGCPSVKSLEQQYGTSWRKGNESRFFSRRNEIYQYIKDKALAERITEEEAAKRLEERRRHVGVSIDKLRKLLKEEAQTTRVQLLLPTDATNL